MAETDRQGTDPATDLASDAAGLQVGSQTDATAGSNAAAAAEDKPLPALFLDTMPDNEEEHPDLAAMNTMMGELTADEKAENGRQQGNDALKQGLAVRKKFYLRKAVDHYTEGIAAESGDTKLNSVLYGNRAQAELRLGNNRNALRDSLRAVQLDPDNMKAYFRAAKAALDIRQFEQARDVCRRALDRQPDFPELSALLEDADSRQTAEKERQRRESAEKQAARAPARALAATLQSRGWRIGRPQITIGTRKPSLDENGVVWPVMFIYPENMQNTDAVEAFHEHHMLSDHLDAMYGSEAPPMEWDSEGQYTRERVEVYYLSHSAKPVGEDQLTEFLHGGWPEGLPQEEGPQRYGANRAEWVRVDQGQTLGEILARNDYVVPGIPVLFVVSKGSQFAVRFLSEDAFTF